MNHLGAYVEIARISFRQRFVYRTGTLLEIVGTAFYYFVTASVWTALYAGRTEMGGVDLQGMISFALVSSVLRGLSTSWIAHRIAGMAQDGSIALELIRPVSLKYKALSEDLGGNAFYMLFTNIPAAILIGVFFGFRLPADGAQLAFFAATAAAGVVLMQSINFILGLIAFWFKSGEYVNFFRSAFMTLFAGNFIPLWLYPKPLLAVAQALPFRFITFEPVALYLGKTPVGDGWRILAMQAAWIAVLAAVERLMWRGVQKQITVHGG